MFWFKKKKIIVDCFTDNEFLVDNVPIAPSIKMTPDWWKSIPGKIQVEGEHNIILESATIKRCIGFLDLYTNSFTLPLWSDVYVNVSEHGLAWQFANGDSRIETHNPNQYGNNFPDLRHIKFMCPWILNEKTGCNFIYMQSTWSMLDSELKNLIMPPAILNFKHQHVLHVNTFLPSKNESYFAKLGTPLVYLIPMTDNEVEFKSHHISNNEYQTMNKSICFPTFTNGYNFAKKKSDEKESEKKCPFHFK
jgi:hypothetical protein